MSNILFGTDGWRAVIAEDFTIQNVERVSQAAADFWSNPLPEGTQKRVVLGYDRRFLSNAFARCAAEVFAGNGYNVILAPNPTPTPSVSFAVKQMHAAGGVMITASHNPPAFNGYKLKSHLGSPCDPQTCQQVESFLDRTPVRRMAFDEALRAKRLLVRDLRPAHFSALKKHVDFPSIAKSRLRVAHDALFGVGANCFEQLLLGTSCEVTTLNAKHDPLFGGINPEPVAQNYRLSAAYLRKHPHDVCLVTDGDADRIGGMDGRGNYLSTHDLICLLLRHLFINRGNRGRVVKALTTTSMVDKMCAAYGLTLVETGVGFKYIAAEIVKGGVLLGAEESGGIGLPAHIPERDGLAAGLALLEMLATERKPIGKLLAGLEREYGPHHYDRIDMQFPLEKCASLMQCLEQDPPARLLGSPVIEVKTYDGVKLVARDGSWLMVRSSGTEPVLRIYAEAGTPEATRLLLRKGMRLARGI